MRRLTVSTRAGVLRIRAEAAEDCELELWGVERRAALLGQALGTPVRVVAAASSRSPRRRPVRAKA